MAHALRHTVERSRVATDKIDDTAIGTVLAAGLLASVAGQTVDRQCSSRLMSIATAAKQIVVDEMRVVAGCEPAKMGIGPVYAVPKLLRQHALSVDNIGLWELNQAFVVQVIYCRDRLGIDSEKLNVNGGATFIRHAYAMSGAHLVGDTLLEGRRRGCATLS